MTMQPPSDTPTLLYGLGLGPGDPDYMTVKARRLLEEADLLVHFCKAGRRGNARTIADRVVGSDPDREMALTYPVTTEVPVTDPRYGCQITQFYEECAEQLSAILDAGKRVTVLCEADPFFYGSFMHLWRRLSPLYPTEVVPAVTGMSAAWTHANAPITWGDDVLTVLPGTLPADDLARRLKATDAAVIMKLGRHLPKVRAALKEAGLEERAIYVERASMPEQVIVPLAERSDATAPYFSMIIVPGIGRRL
ncbi:precorrin-2 C(20)-methyltransferase [Amorphus orientalis]|uniref:Precorrin-2/cobalt-factor-2 C20-methyltransferase n=1 Tax=Amorphus orientalis TaxID=649198 RepID=A0AAE3VP69_9HYPH|nr:precorrin-2 C(20)-methyltransferase [Amorphus orientalis]MDQ0315683.1 precorrin-2/cobalt-factor-2 C20-methyltransferase [Amorphus orientalis]